jgi:tetratricopeptide (TPR) repeat protein
MARVVALIFPLSLSAAGGLAAQQFWLPGPRDSLEVAARADSNDPVLHHLVALAYLNQERVEPAERAFHEALAIDPRYAPAWLGLGVATLVRHPDLFLPRWARPRRRNTTANPDSVLRDASAKLRTAFLLDPLVDLLAPGAPRDTTSPRIYYGTPLYAKWEGARESARRGRNEAAILVLSELIQESLQAETRDSADPLAFLLTNDLRYSQAYFRSRIGQVWGAEQTYRSVLTYDLGYWMAHVRLAELYERVGRKEEAVAERREALVLKPDDPMLELDLGLALARSGQLAAGDSLLARAAERLPRYALIWYHRGQIAWLQGDAPAARAAERFLALAARRLEKEIADARLALQGIP